MSDFFCSGFYRVQSRRTPVPSELAGDWHSPSPGDLTSDAINQALRRHPLWRGSAQVALSVARVTRRSGAFCEPDALYYRRFFNGHPPMTSDVLDLPKLLDHWAEREPYVRTLLGPSWISMVGEPTTAAVNEYMCHEGGHALGWDVGTKYAAGYFRPRGRPAWPLIFTEEFRADLHSFGLALDLLPADRAAQLFAYHLQHRLGLAARSYHTGGPDAGAVPYLLFHLLADLGAIPPPPEPARLLSLMRACADHAARELAEDSDLLDAALRAAAYYRRRILDEERLACYQAWISREKSRPAALGPSAPATVHTAR